MPSGFFVPRGRFPYNSPALEGDDDFLGQKRSSVKTPFKAASNMASSPWNRLYSTPTLASQRKEIYHYDPEAPNDKLDFAIKSAYNQHAQFLSGNNETLYQKETVSDTHGRKLKNRVKADPLPYDPLQPPLKSAGTTKKGDINNIDQSIVSHHSAATNRGYSRRHNGGFYLV